MEEAWIAKGTLLQPDADAEYAAVIEIDLADVKGGATSERRSAVARAA
jgi:aconitase B